MIPGLPRRSVYCGALVAYLCAAPVQAQVSSGPLTLLDVPFLSQSEALCGGAASAMILRYWGDRGLTAESFAHLLDRGASGIRTTALAEDLHRRGWNVTVASGRDDIVRAELARARPVLALIEDRRATFHYVVIVGWHDRGVVFHDPARAPFRVMARDTFDRRWAATRRWMLIVTPPTALDARSAPAAAVGAPPLQPPTTSPHPETSKTCEELIAEGVHQAQADDVAAAERSLTGALSCPGPDGLRELAGLRVLQRRWDEAGDLATAALEQDRNDAYTWRLLATSRFLQNDSSRALDAWNQVGEPRVDLVRVDGLSHTTHRVAEDAIGLKPGAVLSADALARGRRRLAELPSAVSTRLEYAPVPSGLVELRASVVERPLVPHGGLAYAALGLNVAASRAVNLALGSFTGGGERVSLDWRFWKGRPRAGLRLDAPAPWGGVLTLDGFAERQEFVPVAVQREARRKGVRVQTADWATSNLRWELGAGVDSWTDAGTFVTGSGGTRLMSRDDRAEARVGVNVWSGDRSFATGEAALRLRSSTVHRGLVFVASLGAQRATNTTPVDLWFGGDTGQARPTLLRAHPILEDGRLRVGQLGRALGYATFEAEHWWRLIGPARVAAAGFVDTARASHSFDGRGEGHVDAGLGARFAVPGMPGIVRLDVGKGLRDGATALSLVYDPGSW